RLAPASTRIGLVSFSDVASVLVPPTTDRPVVQEALEHIAPARNTSLAAAVVTGVKMLPGRQDAQPPEELAAPGAMRPGTRPPGTMPPEKDPGNAQAQELPPGSVLILSDGVANIGGTGISSEAALDLAARFAAEEHVKLFTLPVGTEGGTVTRIDGTDYFIPFDADALARLSQQSGGRSIEPADKAGLQELADELGTVIRWEPTRVEVSSLFALLGVLLMLAAGGLSLRWYRRVP
ncbi:MAG TPA: VWA domain-containing protein, partial [Trueperaceae bacterium]